MIKIEGDKIALYQWDINQRLIITDVDYNIEVHYSRLDAGLNESLVLLTYEENGVMYCNIPNVFLQEKGIIYVYLYVRREDQTYTKYDAEILVIAREKPDDYIYTEDEIQSFRQLEEKLKDVSRRVENFNAKSVKVDPTNYTDEEKTQARENINALGKDYKPPVPSAEDVGADPEGTAEKVLLTHDKEANSHRDIRLIIEEMTSMLNQLLETEELDPTVPAWAKEPNKPPYTAEEVNADKAGTAEGLVFSHDTNTEAHNDIRLMIQGLITRLDTVANSNDVDLDQLSEIVAYIKSNKILIDAITTSKVNITDIVDNLSTNVSNRPLSAAMGVALKALYDSIDIPSKVSQLENDLGFLTQHQDLSLYAKKSELPKVPTKLSAFENDTEYLTEHQSLEGYAKKDELPTVPKKLSEFENDKEFITLEKVLELFKEYLDGYKIRVKNDDGKVGYITVRKEV